MTPAQWARVFEAGSRSLTPGMPIGQAVEEALDAMAHECREIASEVDLGLDRWTRERWPD